MKTKINFTFQYKGKQLKFKNVTVNVGTHGSHAPMGGVSQVVRQFVKQVFPQVGKFWISTDSFSMGDSVDVYLNEVSDELFGEVRQSLKGLFQYGRFDGMTDMYDMKEGLTGVTTEVNGNVVEFDTKYFSTQNRPKWGTKEYEEYFEKEG